MEEFKVVNTYERTWFFRVIVIFVCSSFLIQIMKGGIYYDVTILSKYFGMCSLEEYVKAFDAVWAKGLQIFFEGSISCSIIAWVLVAHDQRVGACIDIITDASVLVITAVHFLLSIYCYKAHILFNGAAMRLFLRLALIVAALLVHIGAYRRNADKFHNDDRTVRRVFISVMTLFLAVSASFVVRACLVYDKYHIIYGSYVGEKHVPKTELEDKICNYRKAGVANGDEIYYLENGIRMVDADGKIRELLTYERLMEYADASDQSSQLSKMTTIDYYMGWVYFVWGTPEAEYLSRLNVDTGDFEMLLSDTSGSGIIYKCAVRDGFLYYVTEPDVYESDALEAALVYRVPIGESVDMGKAELYLGNLYPSVIRRFYAQIIYDEYCYMTEFVPDEESSSRCKKDGYAYTLLQKDEDLDRMRLVRFKESDHKRLLHKMEENYSLRLKGPESQIEVLAENVVDFSLYGDAVYYLTMSGDTLELYQMEPDGTAASMLAQFDGCAGERYCTYLLVCDDKVLVKYSAAGEYHEEVVHVRRAL